MSAIARFLWTQHVKQPAAAPERGSDPYLASQGPRTAPSRRLVDINNKPYQYIFNSLCPQGVRSATQVWQPYLTAVASPETRAVGGCDQGNCSRALLLSLDSPRITGGAMDRLRQWWLNDLPIGVKLALLVLLANAGPAISILMTFPGRTETLFVWTIEPFINARLMGVMYANALILIGMGVLQPSWARVRIIMAQITVFSFTATALTFVYLKPFLAHPWFHLAFWLTVYLALCVVAPFVFVTQERKRGGRLPVRIPLSTATRLLAGASLLICLVCGLGLLFQVDTVNQVWPWTLPPLVGGLIGVLFTSQIAAYAWALWDGDWMRIRPVFWQVPPTALLFILLPLLHPADLRPDAGPALALYYAIAGLLMLSSLGVILSYRSAERSTMRP